MTTSGGTLMTWAEFMEAVIDHWFIDYDGWGYRADGDGNRSGAPICPSEAKDVQDPPTHVMWYNR